MNFNGAMYQALKLCISDPDKAELLELEFADLPPSLLNDYVSRHDDFPASLYCFHKGCNGSIPQGESSFNVWVVYTRSLNSTRPPTFLFFFF